MLKNQKEEGVGMKEKKIVQMGADPFPPYQYYKTDGTLAGSDYERVAQIAAAAGWELHVILREWSEIQAMMENCELDAAFQVQDTEERAKRYAFSRLLRNAVTEVVSGDPLLRIGSYSEIEERNLTLGMIEGYTNGAEIDNIKGRYKKTYPSAVALLRGISRREVDLGVFDQGVKNYLMAEHGIDGIYAIQAMTYLRPLHVIFQSAQLREEFDCSMAETV